MTKREFRLLEHLKNEIKVEFQRKIQSHSNHYGNKALWVVYLENGSGKIENAANKIKNMAIKSQPALEYYKKFDGTKIKVDLTLQ